MPNQSDPNQTDPNNPTPVVSPIIPDSSDQPVIPAFQEVPQQVPAEVSPAPTSPEPIGTAAPISFPEMTSSPKKKFGGEKVIATILGLFLLVGGIGAGILLTQQQQILAPKAVGAGECACKPDNGATITGQCNSDNSCTCPSGYNEGTNKCGQGGGGGNGEEITPGNCSATQSRTGWVQCGNGTGLASCTFCLNPDQRTCNQILATKPECSGSTSYAMPLPVLWTLFIVRGILRPILRMVVKKKIHYQQGYIGTMPAIP